MIANLIALAFLMPTTEMDISYSKAAGDDIKMDVHMPAGDAKNNPGVVLIHGGAWVSGNKKELDGMATNLASQGFVVANINYRLAPKSKWPAQLDDCQAAVRYFRANAKKYNVDPKRIGAAGFSAGGHLAMFLGTVEATGKDLENAKMSSKVKVVLNYFGPSDLTRDFPKFIADSVSKQLTGKPYDPKDPDVVSFSPYYKIDKNSAPMFIFQGLADPLVNPNQSRIVEAKYKELGLPVEAHYLEGVGHEVPMAKAGVKEAVEKSVAFLKAYLDK
ncbi:MAG: alpha/beta hydrolase [Armatimonadetes bacterium]|nr:alpha/beta hydrolase [Armatimonadota bacterium]